MKVCIVSDSHDRSEPLLAAIAEAQSNRAQGVIHCGDLIGVNTLRTSSNLVFPSTLFTAATSAMLLRYTA